MEQGEQVLAALGHVQVEADGLLDHVQAGLFALGLPVALELGQDVLLEVAEDGEEDLLLVFEMIENGALGGAGHARQLAHGGVLVALAGEQEGGGLEDGVLLFQGGLGHVASKIRLSAQSVF